MTPPTSAAKSAAQILFNARWMVGLTQAEVAQRAGISQQMVAAYEKGYRQPSFATLSRLVQGCGVRLSWHLVPEPGLEDGFTIDLLAKPQLERLEPAMSAAVRAIPPAPTHLPVLVGGKAAARLHGAVVRVYELELWFDDGADVDEVNNYLAGAGYVEVSLMGEVSSPALTRSQLTGGWTLAGKGVDVRVRLVENLIDFARRAMALTVSEDAHEVLVASTLDCTDGWHDRDLDHLALQRAVRLARTQRIDDPQRTKREYKQ